MRTHAVVGHAQPLVTHDVTDEAQAIELAGFVPRVVEGHADNIKITRPEDLPLADYYLRTQGGE